MNPSKEYVLTVGESAKLKRGLFTTYSLVYAGMVSENVFSVVVSWSAGHNSASYTCISKKDSARCTCWTDR